MRPLVIVGLAVALFAFAVGCDSNDDKKPGASDAGGAMAGQTGSGGSTAGRTGSGGSKGSSSGASQSGVCSPAKTCHVDYPCSQFRLDKPKCVRGEIAFRHIGRTVTCEEACGTSCCSGGTCDESDEDCPTDQGCAYPDATPGSVDIEAKCVPKSQLCGGEQKKTCPAGQYCELYGFYCDNTYCSTPDICDYLNGGGMGVCHPLPPESECQGTDTPVCGCDGKTYANDCERKKANAAWAKKGPCR